MKGVWFAKVTGVFFIGLGIFGFFVREAFGMHFDLLHNLVHMIVGTLAISSVMSGEAAVRRFARLAGWFFAALLVLGLTAPGLLGMMHMEMTENVMHLLIAAAGIWIGYGDALRRPGRLTKSV